MLNPGLKISLPSPDDLPRMGEHTKGFRACGGPENIMYFNVTYYEEPWYQDSIICKTLHFADDKGGQHEWVDSWYDNVEQNILWTDSMVVIMFVTLILFCAVKHMTPAVSVFEHIQSEFENLSSDMYLSAGTFPQSACLS